jgi:hypothetical protein
MPIGGSLVTRPSEARSSLWPSRRQRAWQSSSRAWQASASRNAPAAVIIPAEVSVGAGAGAS